MLIYEHTHKYWTTSEVFDNGNQSGFHLLREIRIFAGCSWIAYSFFVFFKYISCAYLLIGQNNVIYSNTQDIICDCSKQLFFFVGLLEMFLIWMSRLNLSVMCYCALHIFCLCTVLIIMPKSGHLGVFAFSNNHHACVWQVSWVMTIQFPLRLLSSQWMAFRSEWNVWRSS